MKCNVSIKSNVNSNLLDNVEKELKFMLSESNDNWKKKLKYFRFIFLPLCIIGIVGGIFDIVFKPTWFTTIFQESMFTMIFIIFGIFYHYFFEPFLIKQREKYPEKLVKKARNLSPYQANHEIKGDLITYFREKNDVWNIAWFKRLKGVAIHGQSVTIFFKSWSSKDPNIVIIHDEPNQIEEVMTCLNIDFKKSSCLK